MNSIQNYFDNLSDQQISQFNKLEDIYPEWNNKINVISRKDIDALFTRHILHSLAIAKYVKFRDNSSIIDVGTGGGFPGIPLAIMFPNCKFHLVDSIGKKIKVVQAVSNELKLQNVSTQQCRAEKIKDKYDFVVSRAVTAFPRFVQLTSHLISKEQKNAVANGIIYLKGGDFNEEIKPFKKRISLINISEFFDDEFFETKNIIHLTL